MMDDPRCGVRPHERHDRSSSSPACAGMANSASKQIVIRFMSSLPVAGSVDDAATARNYPSG
jgi:hypothetical protein